MKKLTKENILESGFSLILFIIFVLALVPLSLLETIDGKICFAYVIITIFLCLYTKVGFLFGIVFGITMLIIL